MAKARPQAGQRVALVLDGHGWATRAVVRSLGAAGWFVVAPARTKSARSRFCSAAVALPDYKQDVEAFTLRFAFSAAEARAILDRYWKLGFERPLVQGWVPGRSIGVAMVIRRGRVLA